MSLTYVGSLSIGAIFVSTFAALTALDAKIQAELTASLGMQAHVGVVPGNIAATISLAQSILANLQASATLAPPSVSLSASVSAQVSALEALIASLTALLALSGAGGGGGAAGIDVFTWSGPVNGMGAALSAELASGAPSGGSSTDASNALVLLTRSPSTWASLSTFAGGA